MAPAPVKVLPLPVIQHKQLQRVGSMDIDQDLPHEQREWVAHRVAMGVLAGIVLAAGLGLFGGAGMFAVTHRRAEGLEVEMFRFARLHQDFAIDIELDPAFARHGKLRIAMPTRVIDRLRIDRIEPSESKAWVAGDEKIYEWEVEPSVEPLHISFQGYSIKLGNVAGQLRVEGGPSVPLEMLIYP